METSGQLQAEGAPRDLGLTLNAASALAEGDKVRRLVDDFYAGRKDTTLRVYRQGLGDFAGFLGVEEEVEAIRRLLAQGPGEANHLALTYRAALVERGLAPNTINSRLTALRSVVKLARRIGMVNWALDVDSAKAGNYRDTAGPGLDVCRAMLAELDRRAQGRPGQRAKAIRDRAIVRLLFDLALRRSSVVALDLEDVDLDWQTLHVWSKGRGQGEKQPRSLPTLTAAAIQGWLAARGDKPGPLFTAVDNRARGKRLSGTSVWRVVEDLGKAVGVRVWPHALRHGSVTAVVDASGDMRLGRVLAGHTSVATTQRYVDNLESTQLDRRASELAAGTLGG